MTTTPKRRDGLFKSRVGARGRVPVGRVALRLWRVVGLGVGIHQAEPARLVGGDAPTLGGHAQQRQQHLARAVGMDHGRGACLEEILHEVGADHRWLRAAVGIKALVEVLEEALDERGRLLDVERRGQ